MQFLTFFLVIPIFWSTSLAILLQQSRRVMRYHAFEEKLEGPSRDIEEEEHLLKG